MGDFIHYGEHSIDIRPDGSADWDNTWETWHIAPSVRPVVNPPSPKTEYVDVPGADGSLDYTNVLGRTRYQNRTGSWTFLIDNGYWDWTVLYTEFMTKYHGSNCQIRLTDDPEYYYIGRLTLKEYKQAKDYSSFEIEYNLEPFKWPMTSNSERDWLWNELFATPSYFGPINVTPLYATTVEIVGGESERHILNPDTDQESSVNIYSSNTVSFRLYKYDKNKKPGYTPNRMWLNTASVEIDNQQLNVGDNENVFTLEPGEVKLLRLYGTGLVKIDVGSGKRL